MPESLAFSISAMRAGACRAGGFSGQFTDDFA